MRFVEEGHLPNIGRLLEGGARSKVCNPFGLFVGATWANFATGLRPDRHGFHCWNRIDIDTYRHRLSPPRLGTYPPFWKSLSDAGRRVAVIDVPHARVEGPLNGVLLAEWGCHDRHGGLESWPPERAKRTAEEIGLHPVLGIPAITHEDFAPDDYVHRSGAHRTLEEEKRLLDGLVEGTAGKRRLSLELLAEEKWDLFLAVFGESHAAGHQLWHLHDPTHPRFDQAAREAVGGDPILTVYRAIDAGVGELIAAAEPDATICLLMSHGMGPHHDGVHMLDELLSRLDAYHDGAAVASTSAGMRAIIPMLRRLASRLRVPLALREGIGRFLDDRSFAAARARQRYFLEPNNYVYGGIRLNLIGREPQGRVAPEDYDAVCDALEQDLLELINLDTGRPAVTAVIRSDTRHRRSPRDTMPDLFVDWDRSAPIERISSPKTGAVHWRYDGWRTGDHRDDGLLLVRAPDLAPCSEMAAIDMEDIGPSLAARLGVVLHDVDGQIVEWLAGAPEPSEEIQRQRNSA